MQTETPPPTCGGCAYRGPTCICRPARRRALLLLNLGTPDDTSVSSVRRYLREFLSDPRVIRLPRWLRWLNPVLGNLIAWLRAPKSAKAYAAIWWQDGSPLKVVTERQVDKLRARMGPTWDVRYAMRYAGPSIGQVVADMAEDGVTDVVVVPMYPQHAGPTTGTALAKLYDELQRRGLRWSVTVRNAWFDDRRYIEAQAEAIADAVRRRKLSPDDTFLLFSAHSMPVAQIRAGDPYEGQVRRTAELVRRRLGWPEERATLSFQSKLGPVPWLTPSTEAALKSLAERGERSVIACPLGFSADCVETLEEIGLRYAEQFASATAGRGVAGTLHALPALNDNDEFIDAIATIARRGPESLSPDEPIAPLLPSTKHDDLASLVDRLIMVGVSAPGALDRAAATAAGRVSARRLSELAQNRTDILGAVRRISEGSAVDGCLWLSTCRRSEIYALAAPGADFATIESELRARLGAAEARTLTGIAAYRHLVSTASGLHSVLPGDLDVVEQVRSAARMAEQAGGLSADLDRLVASATGIADAAVTDTAWAEFATRFAQAALRELRVSVSPESQVTLLGGSTTSRLLLEWLADGGQDDRITFVYRGRGRKSLVRFIRRAAPECRRLRVGRYDSSQALDATADADIVFCGLDERRPVLTAEALRNRRSPSARPLTIIDFNVHGSTLGLDDVPDIEVVHSRALIEAAARHGRRISRSPGFAAALEEVRRYIDEATGAPACNANGSWSEAARKVA